METTLKVILLKEQIMNALPLYLPRCEIRTFNLRVASRALYHCAKKTFKSPNTKGGSIIVQLTSCLNGLD